MIQAIETKYNGYHFRSRLEARWAVFFDAIDVKYEYEPEGFDLTEIYTEFHSKRQSPVPDDHKLSGAELWYLPDFYLPDYNLYVEIKPDGGCDTKAMDRCWLLHKGGKRVACIIGTPGESDYDLLMFRSGDPIELVVGPFKLALGRKCDRLWLVAEGGQEALDCTECWSPKCGTKETWAHLGLNQAYDAARSARF